MDSTLSGAASTARRHKRLISRIKDGLRDLSMQMSLLHHQIGSHLRLRDSDLECLNLISRYGPIGPTALARCAGLHPATLTGVLDRLEHGGWVVRAPNPSDRRAVLVQVIREKEAEIARLYADMDRAMDDVCAEYEPAELVMIAEFLLRTANAGRLATEDLAGR